MSQPIVLTSDIEVHNRLAELGFEKQDFIDVAIAAISARFESVEYLDPAGSGGTLSYIYGTRALRRMLLSKGPEWRLDSEGQISGATNSDLGIKLVFQNTDIACATSTPKAISGKGPAASKQVADGHTIDMFPDGYGDLPSTQFEAKKLWFLCVAVDGDEPSAELYCPAAIENNQFYGVVERIFILRPGDLHPLSDPTGPDEMLDFEVDITKKTS